MYIYIYVYIYLYICIYIYRRIYTCTIIMEVGVTQKKNLSLHQEVDMLHFPVAFPMVFGGCSWRFRQRTIWFIGFLSGQERFFLEEMPYVTVPSIKISEIEINPKIHVVYGIGVITIYLSPNIPKISQLCYVEQHIESTESTLQAYAWQCLEKFINSRVKSSYWYLVDHPTDRK